MEVLYAGEIITTLNVMISGYIGLDDVAVRRELHTTVVDADGVLTPAQATDLLTPKGTEIRVYRGLYVGMDYEWVPMGVFGIVEPEVRAHSDGTVIEIKGFDRVDKLRALHFTDPWVIPDGTNFATAIGAIVTSRMPTVPVRLAPLTYTTPAITFDRLSSPWDAIKDLCEASGTVAYFDQLGTFVVEPAVGVPTGLTYGIGERSLLMTSARKFLSTENVYSGVIVRGEHPDKTPVRVEKWDVDPASPTYSDGPFGRRPYGIYSQAVITTPQAQALADEALPRVTKMKQECEITTRGHPGHEVGDIITISDPRSRTNGDYQVRTATIPLKNEQGAHTRLRCKEA
jgi:hypothetical protein